MSHSTTALPSSDDVGDGEEAWLAAPARRSRFRAVLVVLLAGSLLFLAGVVVQKHFGAGDANSAPAAFGRPPSTGSSIPDLLSGTGASDSGAPATTGGTATTPVLIGTVTDTHGTTWTVKDLGGTSHRVRLTADATVTRSAAAADQPITPGSHVVIDGHRRGSTVTATSITVN